MKGGSSLSPAMDRIVLLWLHSEGEGRGEGEFLSSLATSGPPSSGLRPLRPPSPPEWGEGPPPTIRCTLDSPTVCHRLNNSRQNCHNGGPAYQFVITLHDMFRQLTDLPLLKKELTEQSLQLRTYIIRALFGLLLYAGGLMLIYGRGGSIQANVSLGEGREMFWNVVYLEALGIGLFLPAMMAGSLAGEKERESLQLLLLTTLPPWSILFQKLLGRLIPMLSLIAMSFPLLAASYSFGGVPRDELVLAGILLVVWAIQLSAIALACSSYSRTTVSALVLTYLTTAILFMVFSGLSFGRFKDTGLIFSYLPFARVDGALRLNSTPQGLIRCLMLTMVAMFVARMSLFSRAFTPPSNAILKILQAVDWFWNDLNSVTGGVVLVDDKNRWPNRNPVSWRETSKKSLGTFRYLFRVLVLIETPILFICQMANVTGTGDRSQISYLLYTTWAIGSALVCVHAASVISSERSRQTLETLLTTPLGGTRIVLEKLSGVWRLILVLMVPMATIFAFQHWFRDYRQDWTYVIRSAALSIVLLLSLLWLCAWVGLRNRSQLRSIVAAMLTLIVLLGTPLAVSFILTNIVQLRDSWAEYVALLSPIKLIQLTEEGPTSNLIFKGKGPLRSDHLWFWIPVCLWAIFAITLRTLCLRNADRWLGRVPRS